MTGLYFQIWSWRGCNFTAGWWVRTSPDQAWPSIAGKHADELIRDPWQMLTLSTATWICGTYTNPLKNQCVWCKPVDERFKYINFESRSLINLLTGRNYFGRPRFVCDPCFAVGIFHHRIESIPSQYILGMERKSNFVGQPCSSICHTSAIGTTFHGVVFGPVLKCFEDWYNRDSTTRCYHPQVELATLHDVANFSVPALWLWSLQPNAPNLWLRLLCIKNTFRFSLYLVCFSKINCNVRYGTLKRLHCFIFPWLISLILLSWVFILTRVWGPDLIELKSKHRSQQVFHICLREMSFC